MSFVSQLLERLGVIRAEGELTREDTADAPTDPPGTPTLPPESGVVATESPAFETPAFDPDRTISSLDDSMAAERTLVSAPVERTQPGGPPPAPSTRTTTLRTLLAERGLSHGAPIGDLGIDVDAMLEQPLSHAYEEAGLPPSRPECGIEEVVLAIRAGRAEGLTPVQVRFRVEAAVVDAGGSLRDVAADAAAKDEVLDAFEDALRTQVGVRDARRAEEAETLQRQILALQAQRESLLADAAAERNRFAHWTEQKQAVEREWADALDVLAPFV